MEKSEVKYFVTYIEEDFQCLAAMCRTFEDAVEYAREHASRHSTMSENASTEGEGYYNILPADGKRQEELYRLITD